MSFSTSFIMWMKHLIFYFLLLSTFMSQMTDGQRKKGDKSNLYSRKKDFQGKKVFHFLGLIICFNFLKQYKSLKYHLI